VELTEEDIVRQSILNGRIEGKLPVCQEKSSVVCGEIFLEGARSA
jgi:hypothetical protein